MKILVFNGSPKRDKSDTMYITRAFLDGMNESGTQDVHIILRASEMAAAVFMMTICAEYWKRSLRAICCCSVSHSIAMACPRR